MEALAALYDSNRDGKLTSADTQWSAFRVWKDANQNGVADAGELSTLAQLGITGISLASDHKTAVLADGSRINGFSTFTMNGTSHVAADAAFAFDAQGFTRIDTPNGFDNVGEDGTVKHFFASAKYGFPPTIYVDDNFTAPDGTPMDGAVLGSGDDHFEALLQPVQIQDQYGNVTGETGVRNAPLTVYGGDGSDYIQGGYGNDVLDGGPGQDSLFGGPGNDTIYFDSQDGVDGEAGYDTMILTSTAADTTTLANVYMEAYIGNAGNDVVSAVGVNDGNGPVGSYIDGRGGSDQITGSAQGDVLVGGTGNDTISAGAGIDLVMGGAGNDSLNAEDGDDVIFGGEGIDSLVGGAGDDTLTGGPGADTLTGGGGADRFVYAAGEGTDTITDFTPVGGAHDKIDLTAFANIQSFGAVLSHATQSGSNTVLNFGNGDTVTVSGVTPGSFTPYDFKLDLQSVAATWNKIDGGTPTAMTGGDFEGLGSAQLAVSETSGTYIYTPSGGGWSKIDGGVYSLMSEGNFYGNTKGNNNHADFAAYAEGWGTYVWAQSTGWSKIDGGAVTALAAGAFMGSGADGLVVSETGAGTYTWQDGVGWFKIDGGVYSVMAAGDFYGTANGNNNNTDLAAYAPGYGTYIWAENSGWEKIDGGQVTALAAGNFLGTSGGNNNQTDVAAYFPGAGTYIRNSVTGAWTKIDGGTASGMTAVDVNGDGQNELLTYFPNYGVYEWQAGVGWSQYDSTLALPETGSQPLFGTGNFKGGTGVLAAVGFGGTPGLWLDPPVGGSGSSSGVAQSGDGAASSNLALLGHHIASSFPPSGVGFGNPSLGGAQVTTAPALVHPHALG